MKTRSGRHPRIPGPTTLALFLLALTLTAPWAFAQDPDAITELRSQAEQGDPDAQFSLGCMYRSEDAAEAVRWYRLAADQGHVTA